MRKVWQRLLPKSKRPNSVLDLYLITLPVDNGPLLEYYTALKFHNGKDGQTLVVHTTFLIILEQ